VGLGQIRHKQTEKKWDASGLRMMNMYLEVFMFATVNFVSSANNYFLKECNTLQWESQLTPNQV